MPEVLDDARAYLNAYPVLADPELQAILDRSDFLLLLHGQLPRDVTGTRILIQDTQDSGAMYMLHVYVQDPRGWRLAAMARPGNAWVHFADIDLRLEECVYMLMNSMEFGQVWCTDPLLLLGDTLELRRLVPVDPEPVNGHHLQDSIEDRDYLGEAAAADTEYEAGDEAEDAKDEAEIEEDEAEDEDEEDETTDEDDGAMDEQDEVMDMADDEAESRQATPVAGPSESEGASSETNDPTAKPKQKSKKKETKAKRKPTTSPVIKEEPTDETGSSNQSPAAAAVSEREGGSATQSPYNLRKAPKKTWKALNP